MLITGTMEIVVEEQQELVIHEETATEEVVAASPDQLGSPMPMDYRQMRCIAIRLGPAASISMLI